MGPPAICETGRRAMGIGLDRTVFHSHTHLRAQEPTSQIGWSGVFCGNGFEKIDSKGYLQAIGMDMRLFLFLSDFLRCWQAVMGQVSMARSGLCPRGGRCREAGARAVTIAA